MIDAFLRGTGPFRMERLERRRILWLISVVAFFGAIYGVVMGTFTGLAPGRLPQLFISGIKTPILLLLIYVHCVPAFFVLNSLAGLRADLKPALFALTAMQAAAAVILAALSPLLALVYLSIKDYQTAVLVNGIFFAVASVSSQIIVFRYYSGLIARDGRHKRMLAIWLALYVFVGIQAAWVMRPFIGNPDRPVTLVRPGAWGNAYIAILKLLRHSGNLVSN